MHRSLGDAGYHELFLYGVAKKSGDQTPCHILVDNGVDVFPRVQFQHETRDGLVVQIETRIFGKRTDEMVCFWQACVSR